MIHYILLPASERHALRREYRLRLAIAGFLFVSISAVLGMVFLLPSYLYTYNQVNEQIMRQDAMLSNIKKNSGERFADDLLLNQVISQKIMLEIGNLRNDPEIIQKIISHRKKDVVFSSFHLDKSAEGTSTIATLFVQGKALNRDGLLEFKKSLESDKSFSDIDLPISDLAKSKNIEFSLKFKVKKQP